MMVSREQLLGIRTSISIAPPATRVAHRPSFYRTVAHVYLCESLVFWIGRFWHWSIAAVFATRLLRSMLFEVDPVDLAVIALAASSILLRRAYSFGRPPVAQLSVEPLEALRTE